MKQKPASSNSEPNKKSLSPRRTRRSIHETFEWGFVSGGEDSDFNNDFNDSPSKKDVDKPAPKEKKTAKKAPPKAAEKPAKVTPPKAQAAKKQEKPKTADLFPWEDADDLALPSYGRTSLPATPPEPAKAAQAAVVAPPEKKKKEKEPAKPAEKKQAKTSTTIEKKPEKQPEKKPSTPSLFDREPSESNAPRKKSKNRKTPEWISSTIPPLPQRKRQRWDPEKREYVFDEEPVLKETQQTPPQIKPEDKPKKAEKAKPKKTSEERIPEGKTQPAAPESEKKPAAKKAVPPAKVEEESREKPRPAEPPMKKKTAKEPKKSEPLSVPRGITPESPISAKADLADAETTPEGFKKLPLSETMIEALSVVRYLEPTPIQEGVIEHVMQNVDVLGQAQTGTGKTAAYLIPIIEGIESCEPGNAPVALILVPTRELAVQVRDEAAKLSYGRDIRVVACYGGKPIAKNIMRLREGVDILVGTPGRLLDLMKRGVLSCNALRWVVLDEADRMLDIGFRPDIEKILAKTPSNRQTLLFSATLPPQVVKLAKKYMTDPMILDFSSSTVAVETIEQYYITVDHMRKFDALVQLLKQEEPNQAIIFCRTKRGADRIGRMLESHFSSIAAIHGDLAQNVRDRVMSQFRSGKLRYLVATDVVGRGIDVSGISHIINYDIPTFCDDYVHRVGRTGRMGREGVAFTFVTAEEGAELTRIEMRIDRLLKRAELENFEAFTKPTDSTITDPFGPAQGKPVFGKPVRKVRRAL